MSLIKMTPISKSRDLQKKSVEILSREGKGENLRFISRSKKIILLTNQKKNMFASIIEIH